MISQRHTASCRFDIIPGETLLAGSIFVSKSLAAAKFVFKAKSGKEASYYLFFTGCITLALHSKRNRKKKSAGLIIQLYESIADTRGEETTA